MAPPPAKNLDPLTAEGALLVEHCDIPASMTIAQYRSACAAQKRAQQDAQRSSYDRLRRAMRLSRR